MVAATGFRNATDRGARPRMSFGRNLTERQRNSTNVRPAGEDRGDGLSRSRQVRAFRSHQLEREFCDLVWIHHNWLQAESLIAGN